MKNAHAIYNYNWSQLNKQKVKGYKQKTYMLQWEIMNLFKSSEPCKDCGKIYPAPCMEWDHCRGKKKYNVGKLVGSGNFTALEKEIEKCDLVCANCHNIRTSER